VGGVEPFGDLYEEPHLGFQGERGADLRQGATGHVAHGDEGLAVELAAVVDVEHVGVLDPRLGARLVEEEPQDGRIFVGEELERHRTAELAVEGQHHPPHATLAQTLSQLVALGGGQRRGRRRGFVLRRHPAQAGGRGGVEKGVTEVLGGSEPPPGGGSEIGRGGGDFGEEGLALGAVEAGRGEHDLAEAQTGRGGLGRPIATEPRLVHSCFLMSGLPARRGATPGPSSSHAPRCGA